MTEAQALPKAANFGDLALSLDVNHEIDLQLLDIGAIEHNKKGNRYQDCILFDGNEKQKVKIWQGRTGTALADINLNKWLTFNLSARRGSGRWANNIYYGGFWEMGAPIIKNAPQTPQNAPQGTIERWHVEVALDAPGHASLSVRRRRAKGAPQCYHRAQAYHTGTKMGDIHDEACLQDGDCCGNLGGTRCTVNECRGG